MDMFKKLFNSKTKIMSWAAIGYGAYTGVYSPEMVESATAIAEQGQNAVHAMWAGATALFMRMGMDKR
jgi:hypothetical protein